MRRIAIINQKGGSGKTTTTVSLGGALAEKSKRVLIIDLDPQFNATTWLAVQPHGKGVFDLFVEPENTLMRDRIQATQTPNLSIIGSTAWLVGVEKALASEPGAETILREHLATIEGEYDYVLLDCVPALGTLSVNALTAVDEVLVPVPAQVINLHGVVQLNQSLALVKKRLNPSLRCTGIFACRVDHRTKHGPEIAAKLRTQFPETLRTVIRENVKLGECPSMGVPITTYAPTSAGAEDYRSLANELLAQELIGGEHEKIANG